MTNIPPQEKRRPSNPIAIAQRLLQEPAIHNPTCLEYLRSTADRWHREYDGNTTPVGETVRKNAEILDDVIELIEKIAHTTNVQWLRPDWEEISQLLIQAEDVCTRVAGLYINKQVNDPRGHVHIDGMTHCAALMKMLQQDLEAKFQKPGKSK